MELSDEQIRELFLEELKGRLVKNYTNQHVINEEAWAAWASGKISDRVYQVLTGKPCQTYHL